jgi:hypothetical protein
MTKEEYRQRLAAINEAKKLLDKEYIDSNRLFQDGQRIIVVKPPCGYRNPETGKETTYPEKRIPAYLKQYHVELFSHDIVPEVLQEFKGRPSIFTVKISKNDKLISAAE